MIAIRRAVGADVPAIAALERECFSCPTDEKAYARYVTAGDHVLLVAEDGGVFCGYAELQFVLDEGYFGNLAVCAEQRGRGIGSALMDAMRTEAGKLSLAFLTLEVRESNEAARRLYEKAGFAVVGRRKKYYEKPTEDAILMTVSFTKEA